MSINKCKILNPRCCQSTHSPNGFIDCLENQEMLYGILTTFVQKHNFYVFLYLLTFSVITPLIYFFLSALSKNDTTDVPSKLVDILENMDLGNSTNFEQITQEFTISAVNVNISQELEEESEWKSRCVYLL